MHLEREKRALCRCLGDALSRWAVLWGLCWQMGTWEAAAAAVPQLLWFLPAPPWVHIDTCSMPVLTSSQYVHPKRVQHSIHSASC